MNFVYLQCDCRFNKWLLEKIDNKYVIEHTIEKCNQIIKTQIVAGVFECVENERLVDVLKKYGISVILSKEENVNKRFLSIVTMLEGNLVVRVGGDQVLIDVSRINDIICSMEANAKVDWFYEEISSSVLPDIVRIECLRTHLKKIENAGRYFHILAKIPDVMKHKLVYPMLFPYNFRASSSSGFRVCKIIIENDLNVYEVSGEMLKKLTQKDSYLVKTGLLESWIVPHEVSDFYYDVDNKVNPWLGRTVIDLIKKHLNNQLRVFEWGMGNSTLFWSQYVKSVISVEHDRNWYTKMKQIVPHNVDCRWKELEYGGAYSKEIMNTNVNFDIVMIDGRDRVRCAKNTVSKLTADGIIIWDNTERDYYKPGFDFLKENGFKRLELSSVLYGCPGAECFTSIFYRENNIFGL